MVKCPECSSEDIDTTDGVTMCLDCGHELTEADLNPPSAFKVGLVLEAGKVPGKDKLSKLSVDVGCGEPITVVTAAGNIAVGNKIVIATVGAVINDEVVKKGKVGGCMSEGMVCDGPMLGWGATNPGRAAVLPNSFEVGASPPASKPRA